MLVVEVKRCVEWERKGDGMAVGSISRVLDTAKLG
jgi:hypothetical protein